MSCAGQRPPLSGSGVCPGTAQGFARHSTALPACPQASAVQCQSVHTGPEKAAGPAQLGPVYTAVSRWPGQGPGQVPHTAPRPTSMTPL